MQYLPVHVLKNQIQEKHGKKKQKEKYPIFLKRNCRIFYWTGNIQID